MKPLGFTLEEMVEVMRHLETLHGSTPVEQGDGSRGRARGRALVATLDEAYARRDRLQRQLGMADEFIGLLSTHLESADA